MLFISAYTKNTNPKNNKNQSLGDNEINIKTNHRSLTHAIYLRHIYAKG